ncbi:MAG: glycosyltransferase family 39 protein, partial [Thermoanaerobaculia bacterium]
MYSLAPSPDPAPSSKESGRWRIVAGLFLFASLLLRLGLSARFFGFLGGDDVEILETGLRWAMHLNYVPWEIRNTLLPVLLVAPMGALGSALGAHSPAFLCWLATLPFALLSTLNIGLTYRLVLALSGDRMAARLGAFALGVHWVAVGYGSTVYPRTASTTCVLLAALLLVKALERVAAQWASGAFVALAFACRYSELIFLVPIVLLAAGRGTAGARWRRVGAVLFGFAAGALAFVALVDLLEWGAPFASLAALFDYTIVKQLASSLRPEQPVYWYLRTAHRWIAPALLGGLLLYDRRKVPAPLVVFVLAPLLGLLLLHHKELRYLQGLLPFLCAVAGFGLARLWRAGWRKTVVVLLALSVGWSGVNLRFLGKKSMAAVEAAEYLVSSGEFVRVAAQQPWALGDRLILGEKVGVQELPLRLGAESLRQAAKEMDGVVLYSDLVTDELRSALIDEGLCLRREFARGRSRRVSIF